MYNIEETVLRPLFETFDLGSNIKCSITRFCVFQFKHKRQFGKIEARKQLLIPEVSYMLMTSSGSRVSAIAFLHPQLAGGRKSTKASREEPRRRQGAVPVRILSGGDANHVS